MSCAAEHPPESLEAMEFWAGGKAGVPWFIRTNRHRTTWGLDWGWVDIAAGPSGPTFDLWMWEGPDELKKTEALVQEHNEKLRRSAQKAGEVERG